MATCPLCDRFTGSPDSVEAHISGSNDDNHEGKVGKEFREQIRDKASGVIGQSDSSDVEDRDDSENGTGSTKPPEPSEFSSSSDGVPEIDSTGGIESARLEEDEDGGFALSLVATGTLAYILWVYLANGQAEPNAWDGV